MSENNDVLAKLDAEYSKLQCIANEMTDDEIQTAREDMGFHLLEWFPTLRGELARLRKEEQNIRKLAQLYSDTLDKVAEILIPDRNGITSTLALLRWAKSEKEKQDESIQSKHEAT